MPSKLPERTAGRRQFLASVAAVGAASVAGCSGGISDAGKRSFAENPVAENLDLRPRLGPPREESDITLVSYFGPSCPPCASFHEGAAKKIKSEWIDEGSATMYSRALPFVKPWGRPATHGLLEAYRRNESAFWDLKAKYYANQDEITEENLTDRTKAFLSGVDVDGSAVVEAIETESHEEFISADEAAAEEAGLGGIPNTFVFEGGEFVSVIGEEPFETFESAVESHG